MAGKTLDIEEIIQKDDIAGRVTDFWVLWNNQRERKITQWKEIRNYIYATDTTTTTNSKLPWKNKTTTPKLTQIRDNLFANYMATMFPKRKWMIWEGSTRDDETLSKKKAIESYVFSCTQYPGYKKEIQKLVYDYIDFGNCFATVEWRDERVDTKEQLKYGYVGPVARRINPMDIVFNPTAPTFEDSPKIVRSFVTMGELKDVIEGFSKNTEEGRTAKELYDYFKHIRQQVGAYSGEYTFVNDSYEIDGFGNFQTYLGSGYVELLTFYGDLYDSHNGELYKNHKIVIADRHKIVHMAPDESVFGRTQIHHAGWRLRQDNLWAMGPLDNLVGLQYRIDHLENLKADCFDLIAFPPLKVKGYVNDFEWGPFEKIHVGDDGDVEVMSPDVNVLQANLDIQLLEQKMEEMAGAPKEAMGFRTPGEKTMYEVQRLENAASRIFQNKIAHFEETIIEPGLNAMLEIARRRGVQSDIRSVDPDFNAIVFESITTEDITGIGRIRPIAARHFVEKAERVQSITQFFQTLGADEQVRAHFSSYKLAKMFEELLDISDYEIVQENVRVTEQASMQQLASAAQEDTMMAAQTPAGIAENDF